MMPPSKARGFTLLEVLVATAIMAVALAAITRATTMGTSNIAHLRDKTFAHWVAMNHMAELQMSKDYPALGRKSGEEEMAGQTWYWTSETKKTPEQDMRRVEIGVRGDADKDSPTLVLLTGFFTKYGRAQDNLETLNAP